MQREDERNELEIKKKRERDDVGDENEYKARQEKHN